MPAMKTYDIRKIRADFPILGRKVHGKPLVYLDNGASAQKPRCMIEATSRFYEHDYANIHRAVHELSQQATEAFENARRKVARFVHAPEAREIVFTRGATEGVNLVAQSWGRENVGSGDEILVTGMEHHSNLVPWQMLAEEKNARLVVVPLDDDGVISLEAFRAKLSPRTRLAAFTHVSNALGTINPAREMAAAAHEAGALALVDGAQAVPHMPVDVQEIDADFYVFSGHKMYGPTGIGVLYGKAALLEAMPPWQGGGDMIASVTLEKAEYNVIPHKFEAGTPDIAGVIGLGATVDYLTELGMDAVFAWEEELTSYALERLRGVQGLRLIGNARKRAGVISFVLEGIHSTDAGMILDQQGIAIRAGHHCAEPVMHRYGVPGTIRASFGLYNTREEVDALVAGIEKVRELFA